MRLFLDANILVTVLCNEYPRFTACVHPSSLADDECFEVCPPLLCLATGAYFAGKKSGDRKAREKVALLASKLRIMNMDEGAVRMALGNPKVTDLEDGIQYYSAMANKCGWIVMYDRRDFNFAEIPVMRPEDLLMREVVGKRGKGK
jgi:hypothetical protein